MSPVLMAALVAAIVAAPARAQTPPSDPPAATTTAAAAQEDDPDLDINFAQPDFTLAALPTTLRVPRFKSAFRVTHRFGRPLGQGDFGDLLADLFGLDSGARIGLEYRFGLLRGTQIGIHRTSDRTIQFFAQQDILNQRNGFPLGLAVFGTAEGRNNFRQNYTPGVGLLVSREIGEHAALYVEPIWLHNTNMLPSELADENNTLLLGLGTRLRVRPTVYLLLEGSPRVAGFTPAVTQMSVGIEKRAGGHMFQLNVSNGFGTTPAQIARGAGSWDDWFLGFNISRKFF